MSRVGRAGWGLVVMALTRLVLLARYSSLEEYHPELRTLWGDLEAGPSSLPCYIPSCPRSSPHALSMTPDIPIIVPTESAPPPGLKLQLLPFQKESLDWMKKQELGVWKGGMLAGQSSTLHRAQPRAELTSLIFVLGDYR